MDCLHTAVTRKKHNDHVASRSGWWSAIFYPKNLNMAARRGRIHARMNTHTCVASRSTRTDSHVCMCTYTYSDAANQG